MALASVASFSGCSASLEEGEERVGESTQNIYWASDIKQWYAATPKNTLNLCVSGYFDWDNTQSFDPDLSVTCRNDSGCGPIDSCDCRRGLDSCKDVSRCASNPAECTCYPGRKGTWSRTSTAFAKTKQWYQEALAAEWAKYVDVTFVWQGDCPATIPTSWVPIRIYEATRPGDISGLASWGVGGRNEQDRSFQGTEPESAIRMGAFESDPFSEAWTKSTFVHEIGHILAWRHEQDRPDRPNSTVAVCNGYGKDKPEAIGVNTTYATSYDPDSIMNYCRDVNGDDVMDGYTAAASAALTAADRAGAQAVYGFPKPFTMANRNFCTGANDRLFVGRFDAGTKADLLCQSASGQLSVDLANASGRLDSTDWSLAAGFCVTAGDRLLVADANGDGRDDLICNNASSGGLAIRYATATGTFPTTNWTRASGFCAGSPARTIVAGDFTGDGRADLLCRGSGGAVEIDFADTNGQYTNINWTGSQPNFCTGAQQRLLALEADGDGKRDLVCYDAATAQVQTQVSLYSPLSGNVFNGISASGIPTGFPSGCTNVFATDLNGDGRDDLVCHTQDSLNVATAAPRGVYAKADFKGPFGLWCNAAGDRLLGGAFSGTARGDLACLSSNGTLSQQFSILSPYPTPALCDEKNSVDLGAPNNTVSVRDNACVMVRSAYPSWWGTRTMKLQDPVYGQSITDFVWSNTCSEGAGSGRFTAASQDKLLDSTSSACATFIQLQGPGFTNISLRYVAEQAPCNESTAIDLGAPGADTVVKDNACVKVTAYPSWWGTRPLKLQDPAFGGTPTNYSWANACSSSSGNGTFTKAWDDKLLNTTSNSCATVIELKGSGATNLTLRYQPT